MKHSLAMKFVAVLLAAFSLVIAIGAGTGIYAMEQSGLYVGGLDQLQNQEYEAMAKEIANRYANKYVVDEKGKIPYRLKNSLFPDPLERGDVDHWRVKLQRGDEVLVDPGQWGEYDYVASYTITPLYPITVDPNYKPSEKEEEPEDPTKDPADEPPKADWESGMAVEDIPSGYLYRDTETVWENGSIVTYQLYYYEAESYTVTVYMQEAVLQSSAMHLLTTIYPYRHDCVGVLVAALVVFAGSMVFTLWAAGKDGEGKIRPGGLNVLPLDIYALLIGVGVFALWLLFSKALQWMQSKGPHVGSLSLLALNLLAMVMLPIAFLMALAAQLKKRGNYWWKHMVIGWCITQLFRGVRFAFRGLRAAGKLLPLMWQWLVTALVLAAVALASWLCYLSVGGLTVLLPILAAALCLAAVIYGAYAFGTLMRGVRQMAEGQLDFKVRTQYLVGHYLDFAERLNALSETAMISAQQQTRSERMRTELITNVSHDIKTPLTSIVNFADLLQKPHTEQEEKEYLDVLSRQSRQLKKLIEDLVELSKVNAGSMPVNMVQMDAVETVNQALGEFSDKLEAAKLTPVFQSPGKAMPILADGKLVWRILSNLFTNAIKYAMPGTRLYLTLEQAEEKVLLSVSNVSRQQLSQPAEELMERFVRGDTARNSEGSGLGLNIARSLMELQNGRMSLQVDGDLFKVTLEFPAAE